MLISFELKKSELLEKIKYVFECDKAYYLKNQSLISDLEYDNLNKEIKEILETIEQNDLSNWEKDLIIRYNSRVGFSCDEGFEKVEHIRKMHSLSNVFDFDELNKFSQKINRFLQLDLFNEIEFSIEPKIDGLSFSAVYKNGKIDYIATRGDGIFGENVTKNAIHIIGMPLSINCKENIEVRGEVYISKEDFKKFNEMNDNKFSNPRNFASGTMRNLNPLVTISRNLRYFAYDLSFINSENKFKKHSECLNELKNLGFNTNNLNQISKNTQELIEKCNIIKNLKNDLPYEIDGIVIKVDNFEMQSRLGSVSRFPRWACALKFSGNLHSTKLLNVINQVGRTGSITPIAILDPVKIDGVKVSRATLHNFFDIEKKGIKIGDIIEISRAGDVIPFVNAVVETFPESIQILPPKLCPSCQKEVFFNKKDAVLRCKNQNCESIILEKIKYFVSKPCFNIVGFGDSQVEEFYKLDIIKSFVDIFYISEYKNKILQLDGWSDLSYSNLINAIENSKKIQFDRFILSLGIRQIGASTSSVIADFFGKIDNFLEVLLNFNEKKSQIIADLDLINGIGSSLIEEFVDFCSNIKNYELIKNLLKAGITITYKEKKDYKNSILLGKKIVFTGTLAKNSRTEAKLIAEELLGAKVLSTISKEVDFLIAGTDSGSKLNKAKELGIKILSSEDWQDIFN